MGITINMNEPSLRAQRGNPSIVYGLPRRLWFLTMAVMLTFITFNATAAEKIFIGVLEPYTDTSWEKEVESDWVRLPFFWDGKTWLKMPEYPADNGIIQSDVALIYPEKINFYASRADKDGKQVYTQVNVTSAKYSDASSVNAPVYSIKAIDPSLVNYMAEDENYCQWNNICKRPLILTSASAQVKEDRDGWEEETELKPEEKKLVYAGLRKQFTTYNFCSNESGSGVVTKKWHDDNDVNQIKIYRAKNQDLLVGLQLNYDLNTCDGMPGEAFIPHWFYVKNGEVNYLGKGIMPIEYADYNNDGKTEWIFGEYSNSDDGYDNGYILFTDGFKNKLVYDWSYHPPAGHE